MKRVSIMSVTNFMLLLFSSFFCLFVFILFLFYLIDCVMIVYLFKLLAVDLL